MANDNQAVDAGHILLAAIVSLAGLIFVRSFQYGWNARLFPQVTATVVLVGGSGLLLRDLLPEWIKPVLEGSSVSDSIDELQTENPATSRTSVEDGEETGFILWLSGYITSGLLFGFLYATPVFVLLYGVWKDLSRLATVGLILLTATITYLFMLTLNLRLAEGFLGGGL